MNLTYPTIADIQTTELIYYDETYSAECYAFCKERDIDCLPSADEPDIFFQRNDESKQFDKQEITETRRLDAANFIFRPDLLARFQTHPLQFVFDHGTLTGVVHFSDYNEDVVSTYLYAQFAKYERDLRELLASHGLTNDDMIAFFSSKENDPKQKDNIRKRYLEKREEYQSRNTDPDFKRIPEFQTFYLIDLLGLAGRHKVIKLPQKVNDLRNVIMHSRDSIHMIDASTPDYIYEIETFVQFFTMVEALLRDGRRIHNRLVIGQALNPGATI